MHAMATSSLGGSNNTRSNSNNSNNNNIQLQQLLSTRNTKLQDEWKSQQEESAKLQEKLSVMQSKFHEKQEQWEQDKLEFVLPTRNTGTSNSNSISNNSSSATKIPRLQPSSLSLSLSSPSPPTTKGTSRFVAATPRSVSRLPSTSQITSTFSSTKASIKRDWLGTTTSTTRLSSKGDNHNNNDNNNGGNNNDGGTDNVLLQELETSKALIRRLEVQLEASRTIQESQHEELVDCHNQLQKRGADHEAFLLRYETERKSRQDDANDIRARHQRELQSRQNDLDDAREKLHHQIAVNQDLRDEQERQTQQLERQRNANATADAISDGRKQELVAMQTQNEQLKAETNRMEELVAKQADIKSQLTSELEEQTKKTAHAESRIRELEDRHSIELEYWKDQVDDQRRQTELNTTQMTAELEDANARYAELEQTDLDERTKQTGEFQSRIRELEDRHTTELEHWKTQANDQRRQMELNAIQMAAALEEAKTRYAEMERKHDKEVKEWQLLLNADFTKAVVNDDDDSARSIDDNDDNDDYDYDHDDNNDNQIVLEENKNDSMMMIGAVNTGSELLSPIRKAASAHPNRRRQQGDEGRDNGNFSFDYDNSSVDHSKSIPSQSFTNKLDDLLEEIGEMDMERTMILKEINEGFSDDDDDDNDHDHDDNDNDNDHDDHSSTSAQPENKSERPDRKSELEPTIEEDTEDNTDVDNVNDDNHEESPRPMESPDDSRDDSAKEKLNDSDSTTDSVVLYQTLDLLNNLKTMLTSPRGENEHEVLERLEVLSELVIQDRSAVERLEDLSESMVQSQHQCDDDQIIFSSGNPDNSETPHRHQTASSGLAAVETSLVISTPASALASASASASQGIEKENKNDTSWISAMKPTAAADFDPWPALVAELRNRCEFLERDRDEVTRITARVLENERASHQVGLEAAVATAERKANETLLGLHLEKNREINCFYQSVCLQCQQRLRCTQ